MNTNIMQPYMSMLKDIRDNGFDELNQRTGIVCRFLPGYQVQFDLSTGEFPLLTERQLFPKGMIGELLGFFRGYTNAADFRALGCNLWNANANHSPAWLANPYRKGTDDLNRIYGVQWTDWKDRRIVSYNIKEVDRLKSLGYDVVFSDQYYDNVLLERSINQLENALRIILTNPSDRRIIISGWNVAELDMMALPPCHKDYTFIPVMKDNKLHLVMSIRSWDAYLGAPTNIITCSLFLSIMAKLSGYEPGTVTIQAANAHIYSNHLDVVDELLTRTPLSAPTLKISDNIRKVSIDEIPGVFTRIEPSDIVIENYQHHSRLDAPMAV